MNLAVGQPRGPHSTHEGITSLRVLEVHDSNHSLLVRKSQTEDGQGFLLLEVRIRDTLAERVERVDDHCFGTGDVVDDAAGI